MKQYIKNKLIKLGFKYWYRCDSETDYQLELYQAWKEKRELNLDSSVVLDLCQFLKHAYCYVFFDHFFHSPTLIQKLLDNVLHGVSTACSNRINIPQMEKGKEIKQRGCQCKFYNHIACIKWYYENKSVMLLGSYLEKITSISTVQRRLKDSSSRIPLNCSIGIKLYNRKIGGIDLMNQLKSAYQLDGRSKFWFYLRLFFDLLNVALVNSFIVYKKLENKLFQLKTILSEPSSIQVHQRSNA